MDYLNRDPSLTVSQLNMYIGQLLDRDDVLSGISVRGEISNFKHHSSGHMYFSLKDSESVVRCVMFRMAASRVKFRPEDGMKIIARGRVSVYPAMGQYQIYVENMEPDGVGALYVAFEQLKNKLAAEGLFDESRKKPIPQYPAHIGIITSPTGAAIQDLTNILTRRYPMARVTLYPALVQGDGAADTLIGGIRYFSAHQPDVIIIGRGGGSIEDLWCFNDEALAREIAACPVPVISAVGHEVDFTICDFVADLRAPTPSAAAELAVPDSREILKNLSAYRERLYQSVDRRFDRAREKLARLASATVLLEGKKILDPHRAKLTDLKKYVEQAMRLRLTEDQHQLGLLAEKLQALSPLAVLARGYAIATDEQGRRLQKTTDIACGDRMHVRLSDGILYATVTEKESERKTHE